MPNAQRPKPAPKPGPGLKDHEASSVLEIYRHDIEFEDEYKRLVSKDVSRNTFATQPFRKIEHIPDTDTRIEAFEETVILVGSGNTAIPPVLKEKGIDVKVVAEPCPECRGINLIHGDGCVHCIPVLESLSEQEDQKVSDITLLHAKHPDHFRVRGTNRDNVIDKIPVGVGGHTKHTSPHIAGKAYEESGKIIEPKVRWNHEKESRGRDKRNRLLRKTKILIYKWKKKM